MTWPEIVPPMICPYCDKKIRFMDEYIEIKIHSVNGIRHAFVCSATCLVDHLIPVRG